MFSRRFTPGPPRRWQPSWPTRKCPLPWIAVTWVLFALLLLIAGNRLKRTELNFQAYLLTLGALFQVAMFNLYATEPSRLIPELTVRAVTVSSLPALLYLCALAAARTEIGLAPAIGAAYSWARSGLLWLLILYEFRAAPCRAGMGAFRAGAFRNRISAKVSELAPAKLSRVRLRVLCACIW